MDSADGCDETVWSRYHDEEIGVVDFRLVVGGFCLPPYVALAQGNPTERRYQRSKTEVEKALQQIHSSLAGRLPVLDGFVDTDQPLSGYSSGYYQCSVQVTPASAGGTLVRVTTKITAWDAGTTSSQAGYRALPSNGRIESDLLDRLNEVLGVNSSVRNSTSTSAPAGEIESSPSVSPGVSRGQTETPSPPAAHDAAAPNSAGSKLRLPSSSPSFSLYPGIGTARALRQDGFAGYPGQAIGQGALHSAQLRLNLPAVEVGAIIREGDFEVSAHTICRVPYQAVRIRKLLVKLCKSW